MSGSVLNTVSVTPQSKSGEFLRQILPYAETNAHNPALRFEMRYLPDAPRLLRLTRRWMLQGMAGPLGLWCLGALWAAAAPAHAAMIYDWMSRAILWLLALSLLDKFVLDFAGILAGIDAVQRNMKQGHWDMLRITLLTAGDYAAAQYAAAQVRAWRTMSRAIGLRLAVITLATLHLGVLPAFIGDRLGWHGLAVELVKAIGNGTVPLTVFLALFSSAAVFAFIYAAEPRWRLRALAAAGIAVASQRLEASLALLSGAGAFLGIWLMQVAVCAVSPFVMLYLSPALAAFNSELVYSLALLLFACFFAVALRGMYMGLAASWLDRARSRFYRDSAGR